MKPKLAQSCDNPIVYVAECFGLQVIEHLTKIVLDNKDTNELL